MKKIGILTFNRAYFYGAFLQAYALQTFLQKYGYRAEVINYNDEYLGRRYKLHTEYKNRKSLISRAKFIVRILLNPIKNLNQIIRSLKFEASAKKMLNLTQVLDKKDQEWQNQFDYFVSGSDQIWNLDLTNSDLTYFLDFVTDDSKKLSYAGSLGKVDFAEEKIDLIIKYLSKYKLVLVREKTAKEFLLKRCGIESEVVLDPTLLLNKQDWIKMVGEARAQYSNKYIVVFLVQNYKHIIDVAMEYAQNNNFQIILISRYPMNIKTCFNKVIVKNTLSPQEFINFFLDAEAIFTTSFHGMIFSINFNKTFYYELSRDIENKNSRISDIAELLGVETQEITSRYICDSNINWEEINLKLDYERKKSSQALLNCIE